MYSPHTFIKINVIASVRNWEITFVNKNCTLHNSRLRDAVEIFFQGHESLKMFLLKWLWTVLWPTGSSCIDGSWKREKEWKWPAGPASELCAVLAVYFLHLYGSCVEISLAHGYGACWGPTEAPEGEACEFGRCSNQIVSAGISVIKFLTKSNF